MMLIFTNGFKTPLFETLNARNMRYELKQVTLDPSRRVSKISLKVNKNAPELMLGLRLIDREDHYIVDETWCTEEYLGNYWSTKVIPEGQEIIGLKFVTTDKIKELGFVLWTPDFKRRQREEEKRHRHGLVRRPLTPSPVVANPQSPQVARQPMSPLILKKYP